MELFWGIPWFLLAVAGHALAVRLRFGGTPVIKFFAIGGSVALGLVAHLAIVGADSLEVAATLTAFALMCELYLFLFTLVGTSVSVRLLVTLRRGSLSQRAIDDLFETEGMVDLRIARLRAADLLEPGESSTSRYDSTLRITPRGRRIVLVFLALKRFFRHPISIPVFPSKTSLLPRPETCAASLSIDNRKKARI